MNIPSFDFVRTYMLQWFQAHAGFVLGGLGVLSIATFCISLSAVPYIIARLPTDYFLTIHSSFPPRTRWSRLRGVARNIVGFGIILIGLLMLVLPGQGMLAILIGACLLDIPGIRRLKTRLLRRSRVQAGIDWIRIKCGKPRMSWPST